ncbi:MAG: adenylate/guanylate cyclase domain-containing protein, partial [Nitrospinota bacterium]
MIRLKNFLAPAGYKVGLIITILSLIIYSTGIPFFHTMEFKAYDLHFLSRGKIKTGDEVIIIAVDEKSLDRFGRWPWPRRRIAELIERLKMAGAKVIAFDMVFSEPDESSGNNIKYLKERLKDKGIATELEIIEKELDNDRRLASALEDNPYVILGYFFFTSPDEIKHRSNITHPFSPPARGFTNTSSIESSRYSSIRRLEKDAPLPQLLTAVGVEENIPEISKAGWDFGYFNIVPDSDGTVRWAPLAVKYGDFLYPHLSLEAVRKYLGSPPLILNVAHYGVDSIQMGDKTIPVDEKGRLLINYRGPQRTFPHYSFSDVIDGLVPPDVLREKIVLIGATAPGIYDMRITPFSGIFPAVEVHANIIDNILKGDFLLRPEWIVVFDLLAILLLGVSLSLVIPAVRAIYSAIFTISLICFCIIINDYIFANLNMWLPVVYPIFTIVSVSGGVTIYQFMTEERERRKIGSAFSHYVSPSLVNEILKEPKKLVLGGEEKRLTILFSDMRGFTTLSETLKPQVLVKLINDYLTPMTDIVLKNGGTIDKYMGDAIMAFWGAPLWQEDHQVRACRTALEMIKKIDELQAEWQKSGIPRLEIGVGISTGRVTVGNMGSSARFDYTVIGDAVNLGYRLEDLNKEYGTTIIVPKYTYEDVKGEFYLRQLDWIKVKGKNIPIKIYELMGEKNDGGMLGEIAELFEEGLTSYMEREWDKAEEHFQGVMELKPDDGPSKVFLSRIQMLHKTELPSGWDGV